MPIYVFKCVECSKEGESLRRLGDMSPIRCKDCGNEMVHIITGGQAVIYPHQGEFVRDKDGGHRYRRIP